MTEFKGTQGKWVFDDFDMKIKGSGDEEGRTVIANVSPKMNYSRGMTTQTYNALLISKAPEMLEILEEFVTHHFDFMGCGEIKELQEDAKILLKKITEL